MKKRNSALAIGGLVAAGLMITAAAHATCYPMLYFADELELQVTLFGQKAFGESRIDPKARAYNLWLEGSTIEAFASAMKKEQEETTSVQTMVGSASESLMVTDTSVAGKGNGQETANEPMRVEPKYGEVSFAEFCDASGEEEQRFAAEEFWVLQVENGLAGWVGPKGKQPAKDEFLIPEDG